MENLLEFEEFRYKGPSRLDRLKTKAKDFLGIENKGDRQEIERIINYINDPNNLVYMSDLRGIGNNIVQVRLAGKFVFVDKTPNDSKISVMGRNLDLNDIGNEAGYLYDIINALPLPRPHDAIKK